MVNLPVSVILLRPVKIDGNLSGMTLPDDKPPPISERVRLRRTALGLTQEQLAQRVGITVSTVRNIETGRTGERSSRLRDVLTALGLLDDAAERRLRDRLTAAGIPQEYAAAAARTIIAQSPAGEDRIREITGRLAAEGFTPADSARAARIVAAMERGLGSVSNDGDTTG
jgi:transcriptional regulator with XRE-family HTH domain